jgi:hypothetical protein
MSRFRVSAYLKNAFDLKLWGFGFLAMLSVGPAYAVALFLPIILRLDMGFNVAQSLCLTAPPQIAAIIVALLSAYYSDKLKLRSPFIAMNGALCLIGCGLLGWTHTVGVRYFGAVLVAIGANSNGELRVLGRPSVLMHLSARKSDLASQQRPWTVEASLCFGSQRCHGRLWRNHGRYGLSRTGCSSVSAWNHHLHGLWCSNNHHHSDHDPLLYTIQSEGR